MRKISLIIIIIFLGCWFFIKPAQAALSKDFLGLNYHWALGGNYYDYDYELSLQESQTVWAREHFSGEVLMGQSADAWWQRYDFVLNKYHENNVKVVGLLAYGPENGVYTRPDLGWWAEFVRSVVSRYKDDVAVWEIWNEPDSADYLEPNTVENYKELLITAYPIVKELDPQALVINGSLSAPNPDWARELYEQAGDYFDALNVHLYFGESYLRQNNLSALQQAVAELWAVTQDFNERGKLWVTEFGLSTESTGGDFELQARYLAAASDWLVQQDYVQKVLLYTFRDQDFRSDYENNFGLVTTTFNPKDAWLWYAALPVKDPDRPKPYGQERDVIRENLQAPQLRVELEKYFGVGLIPISAVNWPIVVNAYVYGGYPTPAIVQAIRFGGYTVSPVVPYSAWQARQSYIDYINKDWTGGMIVHAYDQPRILVTTEQTRAQELRQKLEESFGELGRLNITAKNWVTLVNAYVYGQYPVEAIARAVIFGGKTVHPTIGWTKWHLTKDYQDYINKNPV